MELDIKKRYYKLASLDSCEEPGFCVSENEIRTAYTIGDDYGLHRSRFSFDMVLKDEIEVGLRLFETRMQGIGLWFTLKDGKILIYNQSSGLSVEINHNIELAKKRKIVFLENLSDITLMVDDMVICVVKIDKDNLTVLEKDEKVLEEVKNESIPISGFVKIAAKDEEISNIEYEHYEVIQTFKEFKNRNMDYSTWIATDDLGRVTPDYSIVGGPGKEKYVGLFYFMCHVHAMGEKVRDHTKIYLEQGLEALKEFLPKSHGGHWAEPYFGYYLSFDEWIHFKHAFMLEAAGVDFIFLDFSNHRTYPDATKVLLDTWLKIRKMGCNTPQIVPMCGDMPSILVVDLYTLWDTIFTKPEYDELLFKWEGKPLILGNNDDPKGDRWTVSGTTPQTREQFYEIISRDKNILKFFESGRFHECLSKLTVRKCWAWQASRYEEDKNFAGYWDWLDWSPQAPGRSFDGEIEQISVKMGTHAHTSTGRSYLGKKDYGTGLGDFDFTLGTAKYGLCFEEQFRNAMKVDPKVIMITGWNEWYAGCIKLPGRDDLVVGHTSTPGYYLVDQFNPEFSRDGEPMKIRNGVGFGDNYYYQMVNYIREFKGINKMPVASGQKTIDLNGGLSEWDDVGPVYTDFVNDTVFRRHLSWGGAYMYINNTGRNDIDYAKVSQDDEYIYFLVTTAHPLVFVDESNFMNLFIDIDMNHDTGWEGYDFIINRNREEKTVSVERFVNNSWEFEEAGRAEYKLYKKCLMLKVAKKILGFEGKKVSFDFKWADNSTTTGNVMEFMDLGDAAPDSRFNFRYVVE